MIAEGADGATRQEICTSLGFGPDSQQEINEFCRDLMVLASKAASKDEVLQIANVAVLNKDFKLLESYRKSVKNYYDASAFNLDFATQDVAGYVNRWASEHTNGVIEKVLNNVDPTTRAILMNALYFKAQWMIPFDEYYTAEGDFTGADGKVRKEMMMKSEPNDFKYAKQDGFSALRMEYGSSYVKAANDKGTVDFQVTNHNMFLTSIKASDGEATSRIIQSSPYVVIDEAHKLLEAAQVLTCSEFLQDERRIAVCGLCEAGGEDQCERNRHRGCRRVCRNDGLQHWTGAAEARGIHRRPSFPLCHRGKDHRHYPVYG